MADRHRSALHIALAVLPALLALYLVPQDDGLRHVGLAFGDARTWGEVYPLSAFAAAGDYDPWWGYDAVLRGCALALQGLGLEAPWVPFVLMKVLVAAFLAALLWLVARRGRLATVIGDAYGLVLVMLLIGVALAQPVMRFASIRPFAFGTFFLLYGVGAKGAVRGALASALVTFAYPYLAWMYIAPLAVAHVWRGSRSFAAGALGVLGVSLVLQPVGFWSLMQSVVASDALRAELDEKITEFASLAAGLGTLGLLALVGALLWPRLSKQSRRLRVEHVVVLLFLPASFKYVRYLTDVVVPLLVVAHGADLVRVARAPFERMCAQWAACLRGRAASDAPPPVRDKTHSGRSTPLRVLLTLGYAGLLVSLVMHAAAQYGRLAAVRTTLAPLPQGAFVLTEFNRQYQMLFARPDLSLLPSSEIGFVKPALRDGYLDYMNRGRVCTFARRIDAPFFVEAGGRPLDPRDTACLSLLGEHDRWRVWRVDSGDEP
jgi:hypothetical protein